LDNRKSNLRFCTRNENNQNRSKFTKGSKYKGVYKTTSGKWQASIKSKGKNFYLGSFETQIDAAKAYNDKAIEFYGQFANINKLEESERGNGGFGSTGNA
jgi:hypothetical protein